MDLASWSAFAGLLLLVMAISDSLLARLPLSTSMLYLAIGAAASPLWLDWLHIAAATDAHALEHIAEVVLLVSLFGSGLKMSVGLSDGRWLLPLRLAVVSMLVTVALMAAAGVAWLGLSLGAAILLGGILAPTDPVLASDVQLAEPTDRDRLRFSLTGEAGLNDGTAFPFVLLGLGVLGVHDLGDSLWRWFALDVIWAVGAGIGLGAALGTLLGRLVLYLRRRHAEAVGLDNFLALGLIGLAYGLASLAHGYGFLAVFAAGVALRRVEQHASAEAARVDGAQGETRNSAASRRKRARLATAAAVAHADPDRDKATQAATHPQHAPAFMAHAVLSFNEQIERIAEVVAVIAVGTLLWAVDWSRASWWFVALLLLVIRPVAVLVGLVRSQTSKSQRGLIGWFGIRGIGSLFYLAYAIDHGLAPEEAETMTALVLSVIVVSIVVHGISVTPLMAFYERRKVARSKAA
jgi:sodium/hydrogen antiporter